MNDADVAAAAMAWAAAQYRKKHQQQFLPSDPQQRQNTQQQQQQMPNNCNVPMGNFPSAAYAAAAAAACWSSSSVAVNSDDIKWMPPTFTAAFMANNNTMVPSRNEPFGTCMSMGSINAKSQNAASNHQQERQNAETARKFVEFAKKNKNFNFQKLLICKIYFNKMFFNLKNLLNYFFLLNIQKLRKSQIFLKFGTFQQL